ncbi:hypothetical protein [Thiohalophilus sp.]|uniref:hypothetical protein n=1 Tax=Thiohalophilus sp. TaxID=3028392 RepID=UPI002ACD7F63|nr:hypothetical protein [Thiohalophilus sp.]MDZ7803483.1 hypothetical protein [Thiohalophilus sp.]
MFIYIKKINNEYKINGSQDVILGNENINGDTGPWAKWSWDGEKLIAEVDRLGMHPLFYSGNRSYVAVSDSIDELINLDIPRDIDDIAVSSFLILGYFLGVDTPFESIKAFPVGGILTWDDKGLNVRENRPVYAPSLNHNKKEAIVNYVELFKKSINECVDEIDGDFELPLSGGLDSRQIFIELMNLNRFPKKTVTIELPPTRMEADHIIAKELSELYGVKNTTIPYSADPFSEEVRKNLKYDCLTDEHTWFMPLSRYMIKNNSRYLFDGIGPGDLLKGRLENGVSNGRKRR